MPKTFYIIDGHAQIFRAYFAPLGGVLSSLRGEPTKATYVFCTILLKILAGHKPQYLAMAIDGPTAGGTRRAIYADYKATRPPMPDDLRPQIDRILQIVRAMGIPILQVPNHEADDIIATLATRYAAAGDDVVVVSRDKDLDQIVGPHVVLYDPLKDQTFDAAAIEALKGYPPDKAVEVQTLMGDAIDNIPGIPGIGPKTAAKLIAKYGTAEAVVAHADEQTPKLRQNLLDHAAGLELSRKLVTLNTGVPVDMPLESMHFCGVKLEALEPIFRELGFNRLLDQLKAKSPESARPQALRGAERGADNLSASVAGAPPAEKQAPARRSSPPIPGGLFDSLEPEEQPEDRRSKAQEQPGSDLRPQASGATSPGAPEAGSLKPEASAPLTTAANFNYRCIDTPEALAALRGELAGVTRLAVDTETTATQPMWAKLVGISLAWKSGNAVYLPVKGPMDSKVLDVRTVREVLGPLLASEAVEKIGQNLKYDWITLTNAGLPVRGKLYDTMVAAHVLDSTRMSYGLDNLAAEMLGHHCIPISDLIGKGKKQITMDQVPVSMVATYSSEDADVTFRLAELLRARLEEQGLTGLFEGLEMPLLPVLAQMERTGIIVDPAILKRMEGELSAQADKLRDRILLAAGRPFNPDSPKQLAVVLFQDLKLPVVKSTPTGPSTDSSVLEQLAVAHELPGLILDYRKLTKLIGTYLKALAECIHPATGRVHTDFNQVGAATGRLSSSDPNLQNIPIRTEEGRRIRMAFVAQEGYSLLSADYSQVELRVLAHLCEDPTLMSAFHADQDIHRIVAAEVFGAAPADVTPEQRAKAKTVNFGIIYGQTAYGLSVSLRISRQEAGEFIATYRRRFPRIDEFLQACIAQAKEHGYVQTIFGRRRRIPEIDSPNGQRRALAERLAINSVVQGSAADLIKQAMLNIARRITGEGRPSRMLLQIHDELVFEIPSGQIEPEREMIIREMAGAIALRVPLKVDTGTGQNWMEAK